MIERIRPRPEPKPGRQRVRVTYIPDRTGWLVRQGPQQSEIQWPGGTRTVVSNEFVEKLDLTVARMP